MIPRTFLRMRPLILSFARSNYVQGQSPERGIREYFYFVDHQGMLFMDDARMKNFTSCFKELQFLKFFFSRLKKNDTNRYGQDFPYLSLCGKERNFVRCEDLPIVFTHLLHDSESELPLLSHNHGSKFLTVQFQPEMICMVPETGRIYHPAAQKVGGIGLISDKLGIAWTAEKRFVFENGEENPPTKFIWNDQEFPLHNDLAQKMHQRPISSNLTTSPVKVKEDVVHDFSSREFVIQLEDNSKAYIKYEFLSEKRILLQTTQVPSSHKKQGLGRKLAEFALDFCVENGLEFKNACWYIDDFLAKNPSKKYKRLQK